MGKHNIKVKFQPVKPRVERESQMSIEQEIAALYDRLVRQAKFFYPHSVDNAYDLANDTILKMLLYKYKFEEGTNLYGWGMTIMRNLFINDYRANTRRGFAVQTEEEGTDVFGRLEIFAPDTDDLSRVLDIKDEINKLPEAERVCMNYLLCGYKYEQIADIMEVPIGTVKSRIHLARKRLQKVLTLY